MEEVNKEEIKTCIKILEEEINGCEAKSEIEELAIIILKSMKNLMEKTIEKEEGDNET